MPPRKPIYEGKAKSLFEGPEPGTLIQHFKDDATAFNNVKKGTINGKGVLNNRISEYLMLRLQEIGIPTHFIRSLNMREQLIKSVQIVPLEVIVRNYAAGSFAKRFDVKEGKALGHPLIEYCFKNDPLGDPFVSEEHIFAFAWATPQEIDEIRMYAFRINDFLSGLSMWRGHRRAWWISNWNSAACSKTSASRSSSPMKSAPIIAACGTPKPATSSIRTASARISARSRRRLSGSRPPPRRIAA